MRDPYPAAASRFTLALLILFLAAAGSSARASPEQDAVAATAEDLALAEMRRLNGAVERMEASLSRFLDNQAADLAIKRIQLMERRLTPLETELRRRREHVISMQEEIKQIEMMRRQTEEDADLQLQSGGQGTEADNVRMLREIETRLIITRDQEAAARQAIIEMENEVAARQEEMEILEEVLDRSLGLR